MYIYTPERTAGVCCDNKDEPRFRSLIFGALTEPRGRRRRRHSTGVTLTFGLFPMPSPPLQQRHRGFGAGRTASGRKHQRLLSLPPRAPPIRSSSLKKNNKKKRAARSGFYAEVAAASSCSRFFSVLVADIVKKKKNN